MNLPATQASLTGWIAHAEVGEGGGEHGGGRSVEVSAAPAASPVVSMVGAANAGAARANWSQPREDAKISRGII